LLKLVDLLLLRVYANIIRYPSESCSFIVYYRAENPCISCKTTSFSLIYMPEIASLYRE